MRHPEPAGDGSYLPRRPDLAAAGVFVLAALTLCWPMLGGEFLVSPVSDQYSAGYGFREFGAEFFRRHGSVPQWNPYLFGGLPFIAAMHGDIFYPTAWLRWVLPVDTAMNLGFAAHLVLAGWFMYVLLRALRLGWTAALVGGLGYELTGILASLVSPGHDGKLFVSALSPLALYALLRAVRDGRTWGYGLFALTVGLALVSPHYQMTYYLLVACGIWTLYLVFADPERPAGVRWYVPLGLALGAVALGLALSAIQALPFLHYIPYSPRGAGGPSGGWEYATSYSFPPAELFTTVLPQFNGVLERYWGSNFFKLHTEYIGPAVLVPAVFAFGDRSRRPLVKWMGGIALLFLLVSFGGHTPFYRLWYEVMPMMKKVRAPGMAFFLVALPVAVFAAIGADRLLRGEVKWRSLAVPLGALALLALLAAAGALQSVALVLAEPQQTGAVVANAIAMRAGGIRLLLVLLLLAGALWAVAAGRARGPAAAALLAGAVVADLWSIDRIFFRFSPRAGEIFAADELTARLQQAEPPFRILDTRREGYEVSYLMAHRIQTLLGYHGNEVRFYDDLMGGKNVWANVGTNINLFDLLAVRFLILAEPQQLPGFHQVHGPVPTRSGAAGVLYERDSVPPYVRVLAGAAKLPEDQVTGTVVDPRFPYRSVLVYPDTASVQPQPLQAIPPAPAVRASLAEWRPGRVRVTLEGVEDEPTYLLVAETWYPDWRATVDGRETPVHRANQALLSVVLPPGAREVVLDFRTRGYAAGKAVSGIALLLTAALLASPLLLRRRGQRG